MLIKWKKLFLNKNLISCSLDKTIKIWEENKYNYQNIITLTDEGGIHSILWLEDKNILISCGEQGVKFWNLNKYEFTINFEDIIIKSNNNICRINEDKIILLEKIQLK